jgi:hypothetical protein
MRFMERIAWYTRSWNRVKFADPAAAVQTSVPAVGSARNSMCTSAPTEAISAAVGHRARSQSIVPGAMGSPVGMGVTDGTGEGVGVAAGVGHGVAGSAKAPHVRDEPRPTHALMRPLLQVAERTLFIVTADSRSVTVTRPSDAARWAFRGKSQAPLREHVPA